MKICGTARALTSIHSNRTTTLVYTPTNLNSPFAENFFGRRGYRNTPKNLEVPQSTAKYLKVPQITKKYPKLPRST